MAIISQCKIDGCMGSGQISPNGKRYFIKGYCNKHYIRQRMGISITGDSTKTPRKAILKDNFALLPLGLNAKDGYAKVSIEYSYLEKYFWHLNAQGYAATRDENYQLIRLHHMVIGKPRKGLVVDHKNRDKLDNRKENLRMCTQFQNMANRKKKKGVLYKGVTFRTIHSKNAKKVWIASAYKNNQRITIGAYRTALQAAKAYDNAVKEIHGEFAVFNFEHKQ